MLRVRSKRSRSPRPLAVRIPDWFSEFIIARTATRPTRWLLTLAGLTLDDLLNLLLHGTACHVDARLASALPSLRAARFTSCVSFGRFNALVFIVYLL